MSDSTTEQLDKLSVQDNEEDDDEVVEGIADIPEASEADLLSAIDEATSILNLFLNNKHDEAMHKVESNANKSIYHALAVGALHFLKAFLTFEPSDIANAVKTLKVSSALCNRKRKKTTFMKKPNFDNYTEENVHAELCYAECVMLRALVTFIQDENLMSLVKGGLRFRKSYRTFKTCEDILEHRTWPNETLKKHFESGVCLGTGTFNLVISCLPKRILKLVEVVGFSGKKEVGEARLDAGQKMQNYLRGPLSSLFLLIFNLEILYIVGKGCDQKKLEYCETVLKTWTQQFPNSAVCKFVGARLQSAQGNIRHAIDLINEALKINLDWKNFHHISYVELGWCHAVLGEYRQAMNYVDILYKNNHWSKSTFAYIKAILIFSASDATDAERKEMIELMQSVDGLRKRYSGKSNPLEKFFARKANRFLVQNNWLIIPIFELVYVSNYFMILQNAPQILEQFLKQTEVALNDIKPKKDGKYYYDNYLLAVFIKGVCLRYLKRIPEAEECFKEVLQNGKKVKEDNYLPACANMELGFINMDNGNYSVADQYLKTAKKEKTFWPEFRIHQARAEIKAIQKR
ncbi:Tetratricopeptide repeat protein 39B [Chamberlinius hualienensis]